MGGSKMYIEKYWDDYIGGTDDSLTLVDYLTDQQKEEITLGEIIAESGLNKLASLKETDESLILPREGFEIRLPQSQWL